MTDIDRDKLIAFRQDGAHQVMERLDLDVLVATTFDNVRYITDRRPFYVTGWMPNAIAVLPRQGEPVVLHPDEFVAPSPLWANDGSALQESFGWNHFTIFNPALVSEIYADWLDWAFAQIGVTRGRVGLDSAPWQWYATFTEKLINPRSTSTIAPSTSAAAIAAASPRPAKTRRPLASPCGEPLIMKACVPKASPAMDVDSTASSTGKRWISTV